MFFKEMSRKKTAFILKKRSIAQNRIFLNNLTKCISVVQLKCGRWIKVSIFNKIMQGAAKVVTAPYIIADMMIGETSADYEYRGSSRSFGRSSSRSSSKSSSSSRDDEPDHDFFWSELCGRGFRDDRDSDYEAALAQEQDFHEFSQTYYPRKWLEQHGVWGAGEQSRYRQERYREHLRAERERSGARSVFWMTTLAVLATAGALFYYFKTKASAAEATPPIAVQIKSVEHPKMTLQNQTGIQISSVERPQQVIETNIAEKIEQTLEERTGIQVRSRKKEIKTLSERTRIKVSSGSRSEPIAKKQEYQNS